MGCINGDDHATAHVEGAVHLPGFYATDRLQPFELGMRCEWSVNVPAKAVMKTQKVGQTTPSNVANTVEVANGECDIIRGASMEQVNHRVAVNPCGIEEHFTERKWKVVPPFEP